MSLDEILCAFDTMKDANGFLTDLWEDLEERNIDFSANKMRLRIETGKYAVQAISMSGELLGVSRGQVKYFVNATILSKERYERRIFLPSFAKEIKSRNELLDILCGEKDGSND